MFTQLKDITVHYGKVLAVSNVSMEMMEGEILGLLGSNAAGKSTLLKTILGLKKPTSGEIWFDGRRIDDELCGNIHRLGISLIPDGRKLFLHMTVLDNLLQGAYVIQNTTHIKRILATVLDRFPLLANRTKDLAGNLSGGLQELLAIARALMSEPRLLLMDEPLQGLSPAIVPSIMEMIRDLNGKGMTIVLVEHNLPAVISTVHRMFVIQAGRLVLEAKPTDLSKEELVKQVYLYR